MVILGDDSLRFATIAGGSLNTIQAYSAAIGGGKYNLVVGGNYAAIGAGLYNTANGIASTVVGVCCVAFAWA